MLRCLYCIRRIQCQLQLRIRHRFRLLQLRICLDRSSHAGIEAFHPHIGFIRTKTHWCSVYFLNYQYHWITEIYVHGHAHKAAHVLRNYERWRGGYLQHRMQLSPWNPSVSCTGLYSATYAESLLISPSDLLEPKHLSHICGVLAVLKSSQSTLKAAIGNNARQ